MAWEKLLPNLYSLSKRRSRAARERGVVRNQAARRGAHTSDAISRPEVGKRLERLRDTNSGVGRLREEVRWSRTEWLTLSPLLGRERSPKQTRNHLFDIK